MTILPRSLNLLRSGSPSSWCNTSKFEPKSRAQTHRHNQDSHATTNQAHTDWGCSGWCHRADSECEQRTRRQSRVSGHLVSCRQPCIHASEVWPLWQGTFDDATILAPRLWPSYLRPLWREAATMNYPITRNSFNIEVRQLCVSNGLRWVSGSRDACRAGR